MRIPKILILKVQKGCLSDVVQLSYDAFLTSVPISVTADVIFEGWNGSTYETNDGYER